MTVAAQIIQMRDDADTARQQILDDLKPYMERARPRPVGHDVLLAMYDRAGKRTAGGIIIADNNREDQFQGKVGLVLGLGPMCSDELSPGYSEWFGGNPPKTGDWVAVSVRDGVSILIGKTMCRLVEWKFLRLQTLAPDTVM